MSQNKFSCSHTFAKENSQMHTNAKHKFMHTTFLHMSENVNAQICKLSKCVVHKMRKSAAHTFLQMQLSAQCTILQMQLFVECKFAKIFLCVKVSV